MSGDLWAQWAALGQPRPRSLNLTPAARARLTHLAELRDVASPSDAARVGAELASERWLAPDLLAARPWLPLDTPARALPGAVLHSEWTGFLALLGESGPWVYAASVTDLQRLSRLYGELVGAASHASEATALEAAGSGGPLPSLLARLEETDYRTPAAPSPTASELVALERAFWQEAQAQAGARRAAWLARRR
ncbi:hypothetical protein DEIPH_ctg025orf0100 [Deinococcus phoenicis]|uniref:Uncharacterized protein n=1 Tax=Deinococcus phoenicis TaxID=1476583 RepID=A0A016QQU1_9DEIO|nr:hypothetical protein [Deinococcus phoenicis]EYB68252.1 hypothetical protein DEIPH_ctg025orf0100 [Deinococcus phoenicis]